jgi:hypothetical protein
VPFCHAKTWHMLWHMSIVDHTRKGCSCTIGALKRAAP